MERRFLFHALATGISATLTLPFNELIEVQSASAIPVTGGYSASRVENFRYKEILSFRSAVTLVTGSYNPVKDAYCTLVTGTVEQLNILGVVTVDRLVLRLASQQSASGPDFSFTPLGSQFENLKIAGRTLHVELDRERFAETERPRKNELYTLVRPLELGRESGCDLIDEGVIEVPQFGKVYLAEFFKTSLYRSLSMLRIELGCPVQSGPGATGSFSSGHGSSNGEFFP